MEHCNGMMYTVKSGDTLYSISLKYGVSLALLLRVNPYVDVYNLQPGETICIPVKGEGQECPTPYQGECRECSSAAGVRRETAEGQGFMQAEDERRTEDTASAPMGKMTEARVSEDADMPEDESDSMESRVPMETGMPMDSRRSMEMGMPMDSRRPMNTCMQADVTKSDSEELQGTSYVTKEGDTLEKLLGLDSIPLMPGIVFYRQK